MTAAQLQRRVLDISLKHGLGHVGSNLDACEVLAEICSNGNPPLPALSPSGEGIAAAPIVIMSAGHCGLAYYCFVEANGIGGIDAENALLSNGEQPHLDLRRGVHCTTGSLGMGITVAVGYALANRQRAVYVIISDGECASGCVWESLAFAHAARLDNLHVHVIANGRCAIGAVDVLNLSARLRAFLPGTVIHRPTGGLLPAGIHSHYKPLTEPTHAEAVRRLNPS